MMRAWGYTKKHTQHTHTHTRTYTHIQCRDVCMWSISRCSFPPEVLCVCVCVCVGMPIVPAYKHTLIFTSIHTHTHTHISLAPIQLCRALSKTSAQALGHSTKKYRSNTLFCTCSLRDHTVLCAHTHIEYIFCGPTAESDGVMLEEGMG